MFTEFQALQLSLYRVTHKPLRRSQVVRRLNKPLPDKVHSGFLELAAGRLAKLVKTVDYEFRASINQTFVATLARWYAVVVFIWCSAFVEN